MEVGDNARAVTDGGAPVPGRSLPKRDGRPGTSNHERQLECLLATLRAAARGDFSARLEFDTGDGSIRREPSVESFQEGAPGDRDGGAGDGGESVMRAIASELGAVLTERAVGAVQIAHLRRSNAALQRRALELREKADRLAQASRVKSDFLATVSHELRTPLSSLLILAKLLSENDDANLSEKQIGYAKAILASGGDLLSLIGDILDLSKVEADKMPIDAQEINLSEIADSAHRSFLPATDQKGLSFQTEIDAELPSRIHGDPLRMQQVLKNLLANAIRFTPRGSIVLRIHRPASTTRFAAPTLADRGVIAFSVRDTGIGIAKDKQRVIFEPFQQADDATARVYGGTGLGLSISRELARLLGGEIQVESEPDQGSTFTLYLPERYLGAAPSHAGAGQETSAVTGTATGAPARSEAGSPVDPETDGVGPLTGQMVLVVDGDIRTAFALTSGLETAGLKVVYAETGPAAIVALARHPAIDFVIMDVTAPDTGGYEAVRSIRANPVWMGVPIVAISARPLESERSRCLDAGASEVLSKPIDKGTLLGLIRTWTGRGSPAAS